MIDVENLVKKYGSDEVLHIDELTIERSECFVLVGNKGARKTTFFQMVLNLVRVTSGFVNISGENVNESEAWKNRVGSYLDEHMLLPCLPSDEYFETLRRIYGMTEEERGSILGR